MNSQFSELNNKKVYLASDFHLGAPDRLISLERERKIIRWFNSIQSDAAAIFLVGDIFDFWFEYRHVIPKGFIRFQGKVAELRDRGIPVVFFTGNHDLWMFDYFEKELGIPIHRKPESFLIGRHQVLIGHGDGLGPGDRTFKALKKLFKNNLAQWGFKWLHPTIGFYVAQKWSAKSRGWKDPEKEKFRGEKEWLFQHCQQLEQKQPHDYYIFGHRHVPLRMPINDHSTYINLGDWINYCSYLEIGQNEINSKIFEG